MTLFCTFEQEVVVDAHVKHTTQRKAPKPNVSKESEEKKTGTVTLST